MRVEISTEELEALEIAMNFAIKASAILQLAAMADPTNTPTPVEDCLRANIYMSKGLDFVNKAKETAKK